MRRRRGVLLAASVALSLAVAACDPVGGEDPAPRAAVNRPERDPGTSTTGAGAGGELSSQLSRSGSAVTSDLERRIAETLSDLNAKARGADTVVTVPARVLFAFDEYELLPEAAGVLDRLAEAIIGLDARAVSTGHTDNQGSDAYNQQLSQRRARSVVDYLVAAGVRPDRIRARGAGERQPVASNDTEEGRARNRRVEVTLLNIDLADLDD